MSEHFNAVEVDHIELTQYPWFFLARVSVNPYRIQQCTVLPTQDEVAPVAAAPRHRLLSPDADTMYPHFGSAMPQLKQMLVSLTVRMRGRDDHSANDVYPTRPSPCVARVSNPTP